MNYGKKSKVNKERVWRTVSNENHFNNHINTPNETFRNRYEP